jgi:hypothetical protein
MSRRWKVIMGCFMVLALLATFSFSCGGGKAEGKVTIVIGNMTDLTGVAAPALAPMTDALHDVVDEINAGLAPGVQLPAGVQLKVVDYNTAFDPTRFVPGYEWLKEQGAQVIVSVFNDCSETLKPLAAADKVAILGMATTIPMIDPPGWVFGFSAPTRWGIKLMLEWIADQWEADGKYETVGKPTIATVGWNDAWGTDNKEGAEEYCAAHPDEFDYVGSYMAPVGTLTWSGEVSKTLNVDYVQTAANGALMPATFWAQYKQAGGTGINFDTESLSAYKGYITEYCGWPAWDGKLNVQAWGWWNLPDKYPGEWTEVKYIKDVLYKYHSKAEADEFFNAGMGYLGGGAMQLFALQTVVAAINATVEETGSAENFDGQAYYDTAINYMADWAGAMRGFTSDRRYAVDEMIVLRWDAAAEDLTMISDGWLSLVHE